MDSSNSNPESWAPPFCPNPKCPHHNLSGLPFPYKRIGYFWRHQPPFRIQRFACRTCGRTFSTQTFSQTYWQKRPDLDPLIFMKTAGCMSNRQIARDLQVAPSTIDRHIARLGRHCMLFHLLQLEGRHDFDRSVVDGFESFEYSQYQPFHHNLAADPTSHFFIYFNDSPLRRKGRMTDSQKKRREELEETLGRPDPKAIEKDMKELLEFVHKGKSRATVFSDDHPAYKRSIKGLPLEIIHLVTPGKEHRDQHNRLYAVNLLDLLIRHSSANHKRETIAYSKRRQGSAERLVIFLVWRNYMKGISEKQRGSPTPAMLRGMVDRALQIPEILSLRIFRTLMELPDRWAQYYDRAVETPALGKQRRHELKYAY